LLESVEKTERFLKNIPQPVQDRSDGLLNLRGFTLVLCVREWNKVKQVYEKGRCRKTAPANY